MGYRVQDLKIYQRSMNLVEASYRLCASFPKDERFELVAQIRRAATSVPANISEGYGRWSSKEFARFLAIANGSLRELQTHFEIAVRLGYVSQKGLESLRKETEEIAAMIHGLRAKLNI